MHRMNGHNRHVLFLGGLLGCGLLLAASAATPVAGRAAQAAGVTLFEGARLIVGDGSAPIEDAAFIVDGARLTQVGRRGQLSAPAGAARVDLSGKTVMPAIIDTHVHLGTTREALVEDLQRKAYYGVALAAGLGLDSGDVAFEVRDEIIPDAARFLSAGRGITRPEPGRSEVPYWVTDEAEARQAVQELAAKKVDLVKIWVDDRGGKYEKLTPALYGPVIDEAHKHGLRVTAHIFALEDGKGLLRAGVDGFAHSVRDTDVDDEFVALVKERPDVWLVPNLPNRGVATDLGWLSATVPADELAKLQEGYTDRPRAQEAFAIQARNLVRLHAEGMRVAFGTDGGLGWSPHLEMEDMVAAGLTPAQVIVAATSTSAEILRLDDLGTLEAGKSADFLVLDANPLDDISNTRRIATVYLRGVAVDRAGLAAGWTGP